MTPAHRILALAQEELAHALARRWDALEAVHEQRVTILAELPLVLDPDDRSALEDAQQVHAAVARLLREGVGETRSQLVALGRGRQGVQAYGRA